MEELRKALKDASHIDAPAVTANAHLERLWLPNNANVKK